MTISIDDQIRCVAREVAMRRNAYTKWVRERRYGWTQEKADREIAAMAAVLQTLQTLKERGGEV